MTLTEFLLARFAEDETQIVAHRIDCHFLASDTFGECDCGEPARVLAELEAKSATVRLHRRHEDEANFEHWNRAEQRMERWQGPACAECGHIDENPMEWPCLTLRLLALPYADRPDFPDEWRVE